MLIVAALLGALGLIAMASRRQSEGSQFADGTSPSNAPLTPQAAQSLAATVTELMAQNPRNRGEAEGLAMMMEDLAGRIQGTNPMTATQLRRRAAELRTVMVSFPDPAQVPGGQSTVQDVASILTGSPATSTPSPAPAPAPAPSADPARELAGEVAADLNSRGRRYDRARMKRFQRAAGLPDTGTYGTASREALEYFGQSVPAEYTRTQTHFTPPRGYTQSSASRSTRANSAQAPSIIRSDVEAARADEARRRLATARPDQR